MKRRLSRVCKTAASLLMTVMTASVMFAQSSPIDWSSGVAYTYDGSGNIKTVGEDTFAYDAAGRLIQATVRGITRTYTYDPQGNRTNCSELAAGDCQGGISVNTSTNRMNQASYDAAGNVTAFNGHFYAHDALNMQTGDAGGPYTREYLYTADDERIAVHNVGGGWQWTVRDTSGKVLREFTSNDNATSGWQWTKDYVHRNGLLLATRQREPGSSTPTTYHYHLDHLGTPRRITNQSGQIVGVHDYHAFGQELSGGTNEPALSVMKFNGHERDAVGAESASTLDYMHARFYSGTAGRFMSVDPVVDVKRALKAPQMWNRYGYVMSNPLSRIDPDGRMVQLVGTEEERKRAFEILRLTLREQDRKHVSMNDKGVVSVARKAEGGVGLMMLKDLARKDVPTINVHLGSTVTMKIGPGPSLMKTQDLQAGGGGIMVLPMISKSGNIEVHVDPRGSLAVGSSASAVMAHELMGHAWDLLFTGTSSERSAVNTENNVLLQLGQQPYQPVPNFP
jgi:RHS repeat-associated protein